MRPPSPQHRRWIPTKTRSPLRRFRSRRAPRPVSRSVSPSAAMLAAAGVTVTVLASWATVTVAFPETDPDVAAIVASPLATAVTSPDASTVATAASPDSHENSEPATAFPFASSASAASRNVSPRAAIVVSAGTTATALTTWATLTVALPEASPAVAVIVALPLDTAVTSPDAFTVAAAASAARPGHRGPRHHRTVLVSNFRGQLDRRAQCSQFGRSRAHRDGGGLREIGRRLRCPVAASVRPEGDGCHGRDDEEQALTSHSFRYLGSSGQGWGHSPRVGDFGPLPRAGGLYQV